MSERGQLRTGPLTDQRRDWAAFASGVAHAPALLARALVYGRCCPVRMKIHPALFTGCDEGAKLKKVDESFLP